MEEVSSEKRMTISNIKLAIHNMYVYVRYAQSSMCWETYSIRHSSSDCQLVTFPLTKKITKPPLLN